MLNIVWIAFFLLGFAVALIQSLQGDTGVFARMPSADLNSANSTALRLSRASPRSKVSNSSAAQLAPVCHDKPVIL